MKIKKLIFSPLIFFRDFLLKKRPLILNEINIDFFLEDAVFKIQKDNIYLSEGLVKKEEPVDVVFTWVDDSDIRWKEKLEKFKKNENLPHASDAPERFSNSDEIFYSVNSVLKNLPWVRKIFIVTDNQIHEGLINKEKVSFVYHSSIIPNEYLPTFNSHVIEAFLHKIDGLSENFIYFNDDVFVAKKIEKEHFFSKNNLASAFFNKKKISSLKNLTATLFASRNAKKLIENKFCCEIDIGFVHTYFPLKKSVYEFVWENFTEEIECFLNEKFRSEKDLNLATFLVPWVSYLMGKSTSAVDICYYFNHRSVSSEKFWNILLQKKKLPHSFCANDFQGGKNIVKSCSLKDKLAEFYNE